MSRPTVHTDPELRADVVAFLEASKVRGICVPEAQELVGRLTARIEELEALGRTPRFVTDEDTRRRKREVSIQCSRCSAFFVYDVTDAREVGRCFVVNCPCGAERAISEDPKGTPAR